LFEKTFWVIQTPVLAQQHILRQKSHFAEAISNTVGID